jgi:hypothetical protein
LAKPSELQLVALGFLKRQKVQSGPIVHAIRIQFSKAPCNGKSTANPEFEHFVESQLSEVVRHKMFRIGRSSEGDSNTINESQLHRAKHCRPTL